MQTTCVQCETPFRTIFELCRLMAQQQPDSPVLQAPTQAALPYADLLQQVTITAQQLRDAGIQRNDRVAIVLPNGALAAAAFLAIAAAATCAPLNPQYSAADFEFYLSDLDAKALVILADMPSPARAIATKMAIPMIELQPQGSMAGAFELDVPAAWRGHGMGAIAADQMAQAGDIALILHTSGTTARPKMVPLTHDNLQRSAQNVAATLNLQAQDCCLNVMPLFHIHGLVAALLASITAGGSVVCTPGFDADAFWGWMKRFRPSWYTAVPTIHQAVLRSAESHQALCQNHPLRFVRSSSAAMPSTVMAQLEMLFQAPVIEAYGMTEASHQMTSNPLPPLVRKPRSVGIAQQTAVAIADIGINQLLPQGAVGEVVIRGESVTQGYANHPEANAKAFFDGWFRTGDQGYLDADGYLFLEGRLKEIINRGGEKISPLEVDDRLMELPEIDQAVAFAVPHPTLGEDLAAAVVLKPDASITPEALRQYLFNRLADYKVPSQILLVDHIPKGPTGKLQRIGLAQQFQDQLQADYCAPSHPIEQAIAQIMAQVLGRDRVGVADNFFTIGGDSLQGMQVTLRLNDHFGLNLPNVVVFRHPTVAQLAIAIANEIAQSPIDEGMQALLHEMQALSEAEIERLLQEVATH